MLVCVGLGLSFIDYCWCSFFVLCVCCLLFEYACCVLHVVCYVLVVKVVCCLCFVYRFLFVACSLLAVVCVSRSLSLFVARWLLFVVCRLLFGVLVFSVRWFRFVVRP